MIIAKKLEGAGGETSQKEMCVPSDVLSIDGTEPEVGDDVTFTVDGTVSRSENGELYITPKMINGQDVNYPNEEEDFNTMLEKADATESEDY